MCIGCLENNQTVLSTLSLYYPRIIAQGSKFILCGSPFLILYSTRADVFLINSKNLLELEI